MSSGQTAPTRQPFGASSGNVAAATATATLAHATDGTRLYMTGFVVTATGATSGLAVSVTITGLSGGTLTFSFAAPAGVLVAATPLVVQFPEPIPASTPTTDIVLSMPTLGTGNTNAAVNAFGFSA